MQEIRRVFDENFQVYGVRKVWRQLRREGFDVASESKGSGRRRSIFLTQKPAAIRSLSRSDRHQAERSRRHP
jgi:hypothetical protein